MRRAFFLLHVSIFLWGFTGIFARAIDLTEGLLVWYRMLLTAIAWIVVGSVTGHLKRLKGKELLKVGAVGMMVAVHWVLFYGSIKYSNISIGMACLSLIAVFSAVVEPVVMRQPFRWYELMLALIAMIGMILIFRVSEFYRTGIILGIISAFLGALFTIFNKSLMRRHNSETVTTYQMSTGFLFLTMLLPVYLHVLPTEKLFPGSNDWMLLAVFVIVCTVIPYNLALKALQRVSAFTSNLSINMEPVYGILLAFIFYNEQKDLNAGFYFGAGLILTSVVLYMVLKFRQGRRIGSAG